MTLWPLMRQSVVPVTTATPHKPLASARRPGFTCLLADFRLRLATEQTSASSVIARRIFVRQSSPGPQISGISPHRDSSGFERPLQLVDVARVLPHVGDEGTPRRTVHSRRAFRGQAAHVRSPPGRQRAGQGPGGGSRRGLALLLAGRLASDPDAVDPGAFRLDKFLGRAQPFEHRPDTVRIVRPWRAEFALYARPMRALVRPTKAILAPLGSKRDCCATRDR
jgi:hypothetical protein